MKDPQSIFITGASSGIGAALAVTYAAPGTSLFLTGRSQERLADTAARCSELGAQVFTRVLDVTNAEDTAMALKEAEAQRELDLVIANAGISGGTGGVEGSDGESGSQVRAIMATNIEGVLNTVLPTIEIMKPRRAGQIAIMSSLASFKGLPGAPAYCASKAAVRTWGEGLRGSLARHGIEVSVITPGFVKSPLTDVNRFPMPFLMDSAKAAQIIRRGLARNKARIAFPIPMYSAVLFLASLPLALSEFLSNRLPAKG